MDYLNNQLQVGSARLASGIGERVMRPHETCDILIRTKNLRPIEQEALRKKADQAEAIWDTATARQRKSMLRGLRQQAERWEERAAEPAPILGTAPAARLASGIGERVMRPHETCDILIRTKNLRPIEQEALRKKADQAEAIWDTATARQRKSMLRGLRQQAERWEERAAEPAPILGTAPAAHLASTSGKPLMRPIDFEANLMEDELMGDEWMEDGFSPINPWVIGGAIIALAAGGWLVMNRMDK